MALPRRARRGLSVTVVALAMAATFAPGAAWADVAPSSSPTPTASPTTSVEPTDPTPGPSVPSAADVAEAQDAAAQTAAQVAAITAQVERAEAQLETLQRGMAAAVAAQELAQQQLADAEESVRLATASLAAAHRTRETADSALAASAAEMYMQGGDLQNLTTLLFSPPGVVSDLAVVINSTADDTRANLDAATSAAQEAAVQEQLLVNARNHRTMALEEAGAKRAAVEKEAARATAEAAELGKQQEVLTARLDELETNAANLAGIREAAARLGGTGLLGVQAAGGAPRAAQEMARTKMASYGWDTGEFTCLVALWNAESGWSWSATNPSSGAYGIPQSLPGWKMASAGSDWLTNPATQITWGMNYIESVYGSPCKAYDTFLARSPHWY